LIYIIYLHTREYRDCFVATLTVLTADVISSHWHLCVVHHYSHSWSWHGNNSLLIVAAVTDTTQLSK